MSQKYKCACVFVCLSVLDDKEQISLVYKVTNGFFFFSPEGEIFVCLQKGKVLKVFFCSVNYAVA